MHAERRFRNRPPFVRAWLRLAALCLLSASAPTGANEGPILNPQASGYWFSPLYPGEGLHLQVLPADSRVVGTWFTFGESLQQGEGPRWFTFSGQYSGGQGTAVLYRTAAADGGAITQEEGTLQLGFASCAQLEVTATFADGSQRAMTLQPLLIGAGCAAAVAPFPAVPAGFQLHGHAFARDAEGNTAECVVALSFEVVAASVTDAAWTLEARGGGHLDRVLLDPDGAGFSFSPTVFYPRARLVRLRDAGGPLTLTLEHDGGENPPGSLYEELARFDAHADPRGRMAGAWTCAPLLIDEGGYVDLTMRADGAFRITLLYQPARGVEAL